MLVNNNQKFIKNKKTAVWQRFENSSLPIALKLSLTMSVLIIMGMSLLGLFLITQLENSYKEQNLSMGNIIVQQLAHASSEPLMADDTSTLNLSLEQQLKNPNIIGLDIHNLHGKLIASAGQMEIKFSIPVINAAHIKSNQSIFTSPIHYKDVLAGYARISLNTGPLQKSLNHLIHVLIASTAIFILLTLLILFPLTRKLTHPIYQLVQAGNQNNQELPNNDALTLRKDEIGQLAHSFIQLSDEKKQKEHLEVTFKRYLSTGIANHLIQQKDTPLKGKILNGSVLFCDIVGYTKISEALPPTETALLLNRYFSLFCDVATLINGTIDKFIGDCIMILFGVPEDDPKHGVHAISCALMMQKITQHINQIRENNNEQTLDFRIGICSGEMLAGNLGNQKRMEYTVIGDTVNLASRLCSLSLPTGITIHQNTALQPEIDQYFQLQSNGETTIKGRCKSAITYEVTGTTDEFDQWSKQLFSQILTSNKL